MLLIHAAHTGRGPDEDLRTILQTHFLPEINTGATKALDRRHDVERIVQSRRGNKAHLKARQRKGKTLIDHEQGLRSAPGAQPFRAAAFHPAHIAAVIRDTAGIRVFVVDANGVNGLVKAGWRVVTGHIGGRSGVKKGFGARLRRWLEAHLLPGGIARDAAAGRAQQVALLDKEGFDDVFQGIAGFANGGCQGIDARRPPAVTLDQGVQQSPVKHIQAIGIDIEHVESGPGCVCVDVPAGADLRIVTHAPQQPIGDTRCTARAPGDLLRPFRIDGHIQDAGGARDDAAELLDGVKLQALHDAEAIPQRAGQSYRHVWSRRRG